MKIKSRHTHMTMESRVKFVSPQNISGALQQNSISTFSQTAEVAGDSFFLNTRNREKTFLGSSYIFIF